MNPWSDLDVPNESVSRKEPFQHLFIFVIFYIWFKTAIIAYWIKCFIQKLLLSLGVLYQL